MNLYVSNLAPGITVEELRRAFQPYGEVGPVTLPAVGMHQGRATGAPRGYAFVVMPDKVQALAAAAALDRRELGGRAVTVQVARSANSRRPRR